MGARTSHGGRIRQASKSDLGLMQQRQAGRADGAILQSARPTARSCRV